MGTGQAQLWGPGARDWADYNEPMCTPFYEAVLEATGVGAGTRVLDAGCGGGFALLLARRRGAIVSGFDVTGPLLPPAPPAAPGAVAWSKEGDLPAGERVPLPRRQGVTRGQGRLAAPGPHWRNWLWHARCGRETIGAQPEN